MRQLFQETDPASREGDDCLGFSLAWAGGQEPGGVSCSILPRWAEEAFHGLGFLEKGWKTPAGAPL